MPHEKRLDLWSSITLFVTVALFAVSVFFTGFTHELLLEVGVFLVSIKLVLGARKTELGNQKIQERLDAIQQLLEKRQDSQDGPTRHLGA